MSMRKPLGSLLAVLACLVLPLAMSSVWLQRVVIDEQGYVDAVSPIAEHDELRAATQEWTEQVAIDLVDELSPIPLGGLVDGIVAGAVAGVIGGPDFDRVWRGAHRTVHPAVIAVLEGRATGDLVQDGQITIELGELVDEVLADAGGDLLPGGLNALDAEIPVLYADRLDDAQDAYALADGVGYWAAGAWAGLIGLALLVTSSRRRVLAVLGVGSVLTSLGLVAVLAWVRGQVVEAGITPVDGELAGATYDALAASLQLGAWVAMAASAVLGVAALVLRRARPAVP